MQGKRTCLVAQRTNNRPLEPTGAPAQRPPHDEPIETQPDLQNAGKTAPNLDQQQSPRLRVGVPVVPRKRDIRSLHDRYYA
jgi:hypothetical protein